MTDINLRSSPASGAQSPVLRTALGRVRRALAATLPFAVGLAMVVALAGAAGCAQSTPTTPTPTTPPPTTPEPPAPPPQPPPANTAPTTGRITVSPSEAGLVDWTNFAYRVSGVTDADSDPITYTWNLGDGSSAVSGPEASRAYSAAGSYDVTVMAGDGRNPDIQAAMQTVTVRSLTGTWAGRLTCENCGVTYVDVAFTITQTGTALSGTCVINTPGGPAAPLTAALSADRSVINFAGGCDGAAIEATFNAKTDQVTMTWADDYVGPLSR
ncbi:MAG: PKD domain-containing protein [Acidobacteriota bacterium]